jgi:hypothetical protein
LRSLHNYSNEAQTSKVDSYLNGKTHFVTCGEKESSVGRVTRGVSQGSVLGKLLIVTYIFGVSRVIQYSRFHIYADDLQIYHSSSVSDFKRCYDEIYLYMQQINEWATVNGLENPKKSQVVLIHPYRADISPRTLLIGANVVKVSNLGFVLNEKLMAMNHFSKMCQKVYWNMLSLRPHAAHSSFEVTRRLVLSLILPHVNYGNIVFSGLHSRLDHVSHLESTITGTLLLDNA